MSQRVNIQFSIDLDELPSEVERLVEKFGSENEVTGELYNELAADVISVEGIKQINELRLSLSRADHILDDISKIVTGYIRMNVEEPRQAAQQQPEHQVNPFAPNADTFNNIEQKLKAFSERMSDEQSSEVSD